MSFTPPRRHARVQRIDFNGRAAFLKHSEASPARWRYHLLDVISNVLGLRLTRAVPKPGGPASLAVERKRIAELSARGIRVPSILAHGDNWTLLGDLGKPLVTCLRRDNAMQRRKRIRQLLQRLRELHEQDGYLSQAFVRNVIVTSDDDIGFIDFEEDPGEVLTVAECQARDLLLLLAGLARWLEPTDAELAHFIANMSPASRSILLADTRRLSSLLAAVNRLAPHKEIRALLRACKAIMSACAGQGGYALDSSKGTHPTRARNGQ